MSTTAEFAALGRAIESLRGAGDRLFHDPLAEGFLRPSWRAAVKLMRLPGVSAALLRLRDRQLPGVRGNLLCRTRYIDDALQESLSEGVAQVVLLGAGFDSRAYRIPNVRQAHVFEVDRATMLAVKRTRLKRILGELPGHVTFVAADFNHDWLSQVGSFGSHPIPSAIVETLTRSASEVSPSTHLAGASGYYGPTNNLRQAMLAAGFRTETPTFFICEGVTQYLAAEAVEEVLRFVATAATKSRFVFTYIHRAVVDGSSRDDADRRIVEFVCGRGEPWIFGVDPADLAGYLAERGLAILAHVGADDYRTRYLQPSGRRLDLYENERVVVAEVIGR